MFLARLTAWCAAPALLGACRGEPAGVSGNRPAAGDVPAAARGATVEKAAARPALPALEPEVRVRVLAVRRRTSPLRIGSEGKWIELRAIAPGGDESASVAVVLHAPVEVRVREGRWSVLDDRGFRPRIEGDDVVELRAPMEHAGPDGPTITVSGHAYPGAVRLVAQPKQGANAYDVVNHVPIERYLPGVLAKELYRHWHPTTYAAQAIAARSFACSEQSYRSRLHYDLTNTASSQMYIGRAAHDIAIAAVRRTRGLVLAHRGCLVPGYYSSCCGGRAASAVDAISHHAFNAIPPLDGRPGPDVCTEASVYQWAIERPIDDVVERVRAWAGRNDIAGLGTMKRLLAIDVGERNAHGRPRTYELKTDGDEPVNLAAESMRRAVDYGGGGLGSVVKRLYSSSVAVTIADGKARFEGAGFGHGVGLCQHGAESLARAGMPSLGIVGWYYPGVEVTRAYG